MMARGGLRWLILGTGSIATRFASGLAAARTGHLAAVASRDAGRAGAFAGRFGASVRAFGDHAAALEDRGTDAVYVATPHTSHVALTIAAARCGKHVLCEKPLGINHAEAASAVASARDAGVFLMEAFMYRTHPQAALLREVIAGGRLGQVRVIEASFGYAATGYRAEPGGRLFSPGTAGGAILDVGCYAASAARMVTEAAGHPTPLHELVTGSAVLGPTGVGETSAAVVRLPGGIVAQLTASLRQPLSNRLVVHGERARMVAASPWFGGGFEGGDCRISIETFDGRVEELVVREARPLFAIEADAAGDAIGDGLLESPLIPHADTLGTMRLLDAWRAAVGVAYPSER